MKFKYPRIVLKISGEVLATDPKKIAAIEYLYEMYELTKKEKVKGMDSDTFLESIKTLTSFQDFGINVDYVYDICEKINEARKHGVQIGIVVGGGNYWRGRSNAQMKKSLTDHIGMLATVMNSIAIESCLAKIENNVSRIHTRIPMPEICEPYSHQRAEKHLSKSKILIVGCGTGNPGFSTDSGAAQLALEVDANLLVKATDVDGTYDKDPHKYKDAKMYETINFKDVLDLKVMDTTAFAMCQDNDIPIRVININQIDRLVEIAEGKSIGTYISNDVETKFINVK